jgi:hypothetical protein
MDQVSPNVLQLALSANAAPSGMLDLHPNDLGLMVILEAILLPQGLSAVHMSFPACATTKASKICN